MDRRNFFKKASVASLGLIFVPAVAKVLAEEIPEVRCGEGLWAYVQKNGITKFYPNGIVDMNDIFMGPSQYQAVYRTGKVGMAAFNDALDHNHMVWFRLQAALENEKN